MKIGGYQKITLKDYPGKVAAICFTQGCQLNCPYCHNPDLVFKKRFLSKSEGESITKDFFSYIKNRKNMLDGIVFTGGEPLLQNDIGEILYQLKEEGFLIKLDTNGLLPNRLENLIHSGLLDYVALDYKHNSLNWHKATGVEFIQEKQYFYLQWVRSLEILENHSIPYQLRTTVVREIHPRADIILMGEELKSLINNASVQWFLQAYEKKSSVLSDYQEKNILLTPYSRNEMKEFKDVLYPLIPGVALRD